MASQDLALANSFDFSREQVDLIKATIAKGATDDELSLFLAVCKKKRLDPISRQIHAVKRWDPELRREVMSFQTGIDGFRTIAGRTGQYAGQTPPAWCGPDGAWREVWLEDNPPSAARAGVWKIGFPHPVIRIAHYAEYVQFNRDGVANKMWAKMPANQLHKCAEALALRAAFPEDLGGLHTDDELQISPEDEHFNNIRATSAPVNIDRPVQPKEKPEPPVELPEITELRAAIAKRRGGEVFKQFRQSFIELLGDELGQARYMKILNSHGVQSAKDFTGIKPAGDCARDMYLEWQKTITAMEPPVMDAEVISE